MAEENAASPGGRKVFAHHVPWHPPSHSRPDHTADAAPGLESQIVHAAEAGIDGFAVDVVRKPPSEAIEMLVNMAKIAEHHAPGFTIIPCLDCAATQRFEDWSDFLIGWLNEAGDSSSTFRENGVVVVFTYGAYQLPPEDWIKIRSRLREVGHELFLIGEVNGLYRNQQNPMDRIREYADVFDGLYFFAPNTEEHERKLSEIKRSDGKPLANAFSPSPGYWRINTGSFARPYKGTRTYREQWDLACRLPVQWLSVTSWNDYTENTHIEPSRNFSDAYSRLTKIGAARFRGASLDSAVGPETFWLTAPSEMPDGPGPSPMEAGNERETIFEVLRVGPVSGGTREVFVTVALPSGEVIESQVLQIDSSEVVSDRQFLWQPDREWKVPFLTVTAVCGDVSAKMPLALWPRKAARRFYMAPRRIRLEKSQLTRPVISIDKERLMVDSIEGEPGKRTDLLRNLMPRIDPKSNTARVAEGRTQLPKTSPGWGFWEAAVVTPDAGVAWADPVFIAPDGDLTTLAFYRFDDPDGGAADQSIYQRHGRLSGRTAPLADGGNALVCGDNSWFIPSGSFSPARGPLTIEFWLRPDKHGGVLWGDVGVAMTLSLTAEGRPVVRRRQISDGKRVAAEGQYPVEIGKWSHLAGVFDGEALKLYLNGELVAQSACSGATGSARMGVGRNPYNMESVYHGLVDDIRVTAGALTPEAFGPVKPGISKPADPVVSEGVNL